MTRTNDHDIALDGELDELPSYSDSDPAEEYLDETVEKAAPRPPTRRASGEGYGRPISTETCSFCSGKGTVEKRRGIIMCLACDGMGTKGGAGKGRHPITLDLVRPYRTHMEEKPLED